MHHQGGILYTFFKTNEHLRPVRSGTSVTRASFLLYFTTIIGCDLFVHLLEGPCFTRKSWVNIGEAVTHRYAEWWDNASVTGAFSQMRGVQTETLPHNHSQTHTCTYVIVHTTKVEKGWNEKRRRRNEFYILCISLIDDVALKVIQDICRNL